MRNFGKVGLLLAFAALPAQGQELIFGANVGGRYDSNVNNIPGGDSDFSARVGPEVRLLKPEGELTYDFHYVPTYQAFARFEELDDWDQLVNSKLSYQIGPATSLNVLDIFEYAPVTTNFLQQLTAPTGVPIGTQVINTIGRYNVVVNTASIDLKHYWTELWQSDVTLSNFYYDPRITDGISSSNSVASTSLTYAITQTDWIGASGSFTAQRFGGNSFQNASSSYYYNASGVWNHDFSPTWTLRMQAGPTWAETPGVSTASNVTVNQFPVVNVGGVPALVNFATCPTPLVALRPTQSLLNLCGQPTLLARTTVLNFGPGATFSFPVTSPTLTQLNQSIPVPVSGITPGSQSNLTYFANILMTKQWETLTGSVGYSRSAGSSGLFTTATEVDTVNGSLTWNESPTWSTTFSVIWSDQSSTSNNTAGFQEIVQPFPYSGFTLSGVALPNGHTPQAAGLLVLQQKATINVYQWILGLHSEYKLTKRLSVFGNVFFLNQSSSQQGGTTLNLSNLNYDSARVDLGFHYEFDPIHL
jgi:hypothetical protein